MNPKSLLAFTLAAPLALFACGDKDGGADSGGEGSDLSSEDGAAADALWAEMSGYDSWNQHEDWQGVQPSDDGAHGSHVQIWYNQAAADSFTAGGSEMGEGSILVKEGYNSDDATDLDAITAMKKDGGDWFWARYDASGSVVTAGSAAEGSCGGCHAAGKDSIRFISW